MMNDNDYAGGKQYWEVECRVIKTLHVLPLVEPAGNGFEGPEEVRQGFPEYVPSREDPNPRPMPQPPSEGPQKP